MKKPKLVILWLSIVMLFTSTGWGQPMPAGKSAFISFGSANTSLLANYFLSATALNLNISNEIAPDSLNKFAGIAGNTIGAAQTICSGTAPLALTGSLPTGGTGSYTYQWQISTVSATAGFTSIPGATLTGYTSGNLTANSWFRRYVVSGIFSDTSTALKITVSPVIANNLLNGATGSVCSGQIPSNITGSTPTGGSGAYTYLWLSSTVSGTAGFATASGTATGINYAAPALTQTTWYRRVVNSGGCTDTSVAFTIAVYNTAPGNPAVFGNNVWNVYGYSDPAFSSYAGFYTEPSLSFLSTARYTNTQSPGNASGYQGCLVPNTNFSASFKRTNFTPSIYQIDIPVHDDNVLLYINGILVFQHLGCCDSHTNVWTGLLGASDQVEIRWTQGGGPSQIGANFTVVANPGILPGSIGNNQSLCTGETPATGFINLSNATGCSQITYQWQKSTDSSNWNNIGGATALTYTEASTILQNTWYRRVATDACGNTAASLPVKITVYNTAPGDPTIFGNNVWNAYAYTFPTGVYSFSSATYKGYYIEPSLSFNSTSRWPNGGSPSVASGYQGCYVSPSNNWMVYKRTNFATAIYQVDIPAHDDYAYLYVNGVVVFQHLGCCDVHTNVWTGPLSSTDLVEFRVQQMFGGSYGAITLTPVTPAPLTPGILSPSQTICAGNIPPIPLAESAAPTGGCSVKTYLWQLSTDNGVTWTDISASNSSTYTIPNSIYTQTLYRRKINDYCGNTATSIPDTIYMNATAPGNPAVFGNNTWNVYCFQDVNYALYAGYYTEPLLSFNTTTRYGSYSPPSAASGYQGCQLINTYYSVSMKRTGFTAGLYQIDITGTDDYALLFINGVQVASLTCCTPVNNVWTGNIAATDQIELRWRNNAGPGNTGLRFTLVTPGALTGGTITATNPNLCYNDLPLVSNTTAAAGACFVNYSWLSSTDGGSTWNTVAGATSASFTATASPSGNIQYKRLATDICGNTAYSNTVSFIQGAGAAGNPAVFGNGQWNAYAYAANGNNFSSAIYLGYYTEPLLSFNSLNRWSSNGSPSDASGYQGCLVDHQNHWVSYKRTNFTAGTYQLDMTNHDDWVYVYINGNLVFSHIGCCDSHTNFWTGPLGPSDQVEFRWLQFFGGTNGGINLTLVTPPILLTGGTIGTNQTICYNSIPAAFTNVAAATDSCFVNYQWQYSTGCTGTWTNIPGANGIAYTPTTAITASTCYQRVAIDVCGNTAYSNPITVNVYSATITAPVIGNSQTICSNTAPAALSATVLPTGGDAVYTYQWQSSLDNIGWTNVGGATATSLTPGILTASKYYRLTAYDCAGSISASSASVLITVTAIPVITIQPGNPVACAGGNTTVTVTATGAGLNYQWQVNTGTGWNNALNGAVYSNVNTNALSITGVTAAMNGYQYRVIITGTCNPVLTSATGTLSINPNPTINGQPANTTICVNANTSFNVTASGSGLTYQWQQKIGAGAWTNISDAGIYSGSATNVLTLTNVTTAFNNVNYHCIVSSSCAGATTSATAILTVSSAIINTIGASQSICAGSTAAALTGNSVAGYVYQWQSSTVSSVSGFVPASGANTLSGYTPGAISTTTYYQRMVTNGGCTSFSNPVTITYTPANISITTQPVNSLVCLNGTATYSVTANGPGLLTYQWYQYNGSTWSALIDGGPFSGSLTSSLTITGVTAGMNNFKYYVKIFAAGCSTSSLNSSTVNLGIYSDPVITANSADIHTCDGNNVGMSVTAAGVGLSYQWQQNTGSGWYNLPNYGAYSNVYTSNLAIYPVTVLLTGSQYRCLVTGTCSGNTVISGTINMIVDPPISNNSIANGQILCSGTPVPLTGSIPAGGNGTYTYQWWQYNAGAWVTIPGATAINYAPGSLSQTTYFERVVNSGTCANTSPNVLITINPPTSISDPLSTTVCANSNPVFTATGTGAGLAYQWQVNTGSGIYTNIAINNAQYSGSNSSSLTVLAAPLSFNGYKFICVVTGNCGPASVTSNPATLNVVDPATVLVAQPVNTATCQAGNAGFSVTTSGPGLTYQWMEKAGAGPFTPISNGSIYSGATTATLSLNAVTIGMNNNQYQCIITVGACNINSNPATLTVNTAAIAGIVYSGSPYCATGTASVTQTGQAGGTYSAPAGLVINASSGLINLAASTPGTYTVVYSTINGACSNSTSASVTINALPTATIAYSGSPYCATGTASVTQTGQVGGTYTAPGGLVINATTGAIDLVASTPGTYIVTYSFSNGTCNNTTTASVNINALPTATIAYSGSPYCATGTASVTQTGQAAGTYTAPGGLVINATTGAIDLVASTPGTYIVTYSFSNGTCNNTTTASVTINALPTATIAYSGSPYCATGTASVTQTGQAAGTYTAPAGLVINATSGAIDLVASTAGTYIVTYSFSNGTCNNTTTTSVTINALPAATIAYSGSPYCATGTASVTLTGQAGGTYTAPGGLVINASTGAIDLVASTAGTYVVTYSFSNGTCNNTTTASVTINALPIATIAYSGSPYCATGTASVTLTGQAAGTYTAPGGLVINASTGAIDLVASTAGTYIVTYSFSNGTCNNTTTTSVTINALPTATIAYSGSPYCATGTASVTLTGQAGGTYTAPGGLVINASTGAIDLVASTAGTYVVAYSFSNGTCNNTTTASVTINALPIATIAYSGSPYCATGTASVTLTGQAGGTYSAPGGLVINASTGTIDLVASTVGTYIVTYSFSNGTCNNTTTTSVTINALPTATIAYSGSPYCATGTASVTLTGQAGGTFSSSAGLFVNAATGAVDLVNSAAGTYTVFYTFSNGNCSNSTNTSITINALPAATIAYSGSPFCATGTASVTVTGQAGGTFTSSAGLFINAASGAIDLTNSAPGTYTVFYAFSNGTCNNTSKTTVSINPLPALSVHNPAAVCAPATVDITATAVTAGTTGASAFAYWTDAAASIALTKPNAIAISGTYYITASSAAGCNSPAAAVTVTINPKPLLSVNGTPEICKGSADTLYAVSPGNNINWSTGDVSSSIVINPAVSTSYSVTAATAAGCFNTASITVTVDDFKMDLSANPNPVLAGTNIVLSTSANFSYNVTAWAPQAYFNNQTVKNQSFIITDSSVVFYAVGVNAIGCVDTAYINVTVQPNTKDFFIPNAFTPNNDGNNDIFKVYGSSVKELHLIIVNQWGQTVFETNTPGKGWDGNVNGHAQPAGAYVYALKATLYNGAVIQKRGTVNLIR